MCRIQIPICNFKYYFGGGLERGGGCVVLVSFFIFGNVVQGVRKKTGEMAASVIGMCVRTM